MVDLFNEEKVNVPSYTLAAYGGGKITFLDTLKKGLVWGPCGTPLVLYIFSFFLPISVFIFFSIISHNNKTTRSSALVNNET